MHVKDVEIGIAQQVVAGSLYCPDTFKDNAPSILFIHGWKSNKEEFAEAARALCDMGFVSLSCNLRGHDQHSQPLKTVSREDNLEDVLTAYDLLASRHDVDPARIGVVGVSYGGYLAATLSARRRVRWLVLRAPALYKDTDFDKPKEQVNKIQNLPAYRREHLDPEDNQVLADISRFGGDVLILESENDSIIPHQEIMNYLNAFNRSRSLTHRIIPNADHALSEEQWQQEFVSILSAWFKERLAELSSRS